MLNEEWRTKISQLERQSVVERLCRLVGASLGSSTEALVLENISIGMEAQINVAATSRQDYSRRVKVQLSELETKIELAHPQKRSRKDVGVEATQTSSSFPYSGDLTEGDEGETGLKVILIKMTEQEKVTFIAKMNEIRPSFLQIDSLIRTLINVGGDKELDKVHKLLGMKQLLAAQFDVLRSGAFFISAETLGSLIPSLRQYFTYAEMLVKAGKGKSELAKAVTSEKEEQGRHRRARSTGESRNLNLAFDQNLPISGFNNPNILPGVHAGYPMLKSTSQTPLELIQKQPNYPLQIQVVDARLRKVYSQQEQLSLMNQASISSDQRTGIQNRQQELITQQQALSQQYIQLTLLNQKSQIQANQLIFANPQYALPTPQIIPPVSTNILPPHIQTPIYPRAPQKYAVTPLTTPTIPQTDPFDFSYLDVTPLPRQAQENQMNDIYQRSRLLSTKEKQSKGSQDKTSKKRDRGELDDSDFFNWDYEPPTDESITQGLKSTLASDLTLNNSPFDIDEEVSDMGGVDTLDSTKYGGDASAQTSAKEKISKEKEGENAS